ncbi:MAG: hypothetical protein FJ148_21430 [Deltaproteobacteria bacterium]|nr:hypothetical protein [Deltaproteobacteria bacterium]
MYSFASSAAAACAAIVTFSRSIRRPALTAALVLSAALAGCWGDGPIPSQEEEEFELIFGSSAPDGGQLTTDYDFDMAAPAAFSAEIGGFTLYSGTNPGFVSLESAIEGEAGALFPLPEGIPVAVTITAIDAGARLVFGDTVLEDEGDSVVIGTTPIHLHPQWQVVAPTGEVPAPRSVSFTLTANAAGYEESMSFTVMIEVVDE